MHSQIKITSMKSFLKNITTLALIFLFFSCTSPKKIIYLQDITDVQNDTNTFEMVLQPDDLLMVVVASEEPSLALPYNQSLIRSVNLEENNLGTQNQISYQIDKEGFIEIPNLGKVKIGGLTRNQAIEVIKGKLKDIIKNPSITLRVLNFKISVLGEVNRPGQHRINSERITILEALSLSGDLTIYGKRNNILLVREKNGVKSYNRIDLTKSDFINSEFYYLAQNDVIYVEPNNTKVNASVVGPNVSVILSITSILITIITLTTR